jgi:inorganic pyrophosphatase/exopolyphosphatase
MEDLHLFLSHANKSFEDQSESPVTVVMGNEASDMDSVVTSIIHAYLCHHISGGIFVPILSIPSEDLKLRTDQFYLYERLGFNSGLILGFSDYLVKVKGEFKIQKKKQP